MVPSLRVAVRESAAVVDIMKTQPRGGFATSINGSPFPPIWKRMSEVRFVVLGFRACIVVFTAS
jgi:hypothetical protein